MIKINTVSIVGTQGVQGVQGIQGATLQGFTGIQGTQGFTGMLGTQGAQGITGLQGPNAINAISGLIINHSICYGTGINSGITANRIYAIPFIPSKDLNYTALGVNIVIAATASLRILIYSDSSGAPNTKLYESTDLNCSTTGVKTITVSGTFSAGTTYWLCIYSNGAPTMNFLNQLSVPMIRLTTTTPVTYYYTAATYGSAPDPFGSTTPGTGAPPYIGITI